MNQSFSQRIGTTAPNTRNNRHPAERFGRSSRLLDAASYNRVFKKARRSKDRYFTVLCTGNNGRAPRLGLAIAKKHCRAATGRNRLKRIVRESFRRHKECLSGLDIVVLNQRNAHEATNKLLFASLEQHWRRCATKGNVTRKGSSEQGRDG